MVNLLSLSNELLVQVFSSSDTIQSAATFSGANKQMHSLWVEHNNQILTNILPTQIIAYKDAKDLAILEEIWTKKNTELAAEASGRPRVRLYLSTLLRNAKLAAVAHKTMWEVEHLVLHMTHGFPSDVTPYHVAYYRMRTIVLGRLHQDARLQHVLYSIIDFSSAQDNDTLAEMNLFLRCGETRYKDARARYRRSIEQSEKTVKGKEPVRHEFALLHGSVLADHYRYISEAIHAWRMEWFKTYKEGLQKSTVAMRANEEELKKSVRKLKTNGIGKKLRKNVLEVKTNEKKLQDSILPVQANGEKLQKSVLVVRADVERLQKSVLAWSTNQ
jgi:hypothetical protein